MNLTPAVWLGLAALACGLAARVGCDPGPARVADEGPEPPGVVKDRAGFIPWREYGPLGEKMVGVLLLDPRAFMAHEGRGGAGDMLAFSTGGTSYRWVYAHDGVGIPFRGANGADARRWGVAVPYALVEAEADFSWLRFRDDDGFLAKRMKRLDGTADYPLDLPGVGSDLHERYQGHVKARRNQIDSETEAVKRDVLKGREVTGPKRADELTYLTWLPDRKRVRVAFRSRFEDAALLEATLTLRYRREPPLEVKKKYGVRFGVELGKAYEVDVKGNVVATHELPPERFSEEIPPPQEERTKD